MCGLPGLILPARALNTLEMLEGPRTKCTSRTGLFGELLWFLSMLLFLSGMLRRISSSAGIGAHLPTDTGTTYYLDSISGQDAYAGTSPRGAWKTLKKVNAMTFEPGDRILFKSASVWTGQLW